MVDAPPDPNPRLALAKTSPVLAPVPRRAQRLLDILVAAAVLFALSPLWIGRALVGLIQERRLFDRTTRVGAGRAPFGRLRFAGDLPLGGLAVWWNLLRGEMALVGPRALSPQEAETLPSSAMARFRVPPGLISGFAVRRQVGIAYADEFAQDVEDVEQGSLVNDLGLLVRALLGGLLGGLLSGKGQPLARPDRVSIFGVGMDNATMQEALDWVMTASEPRAMDDGAQKAARKQLAFVNADCLNIAWRDPAYKATLRACDRVFADGIGLRLGGRMLGVELRDNVNGTDMYPLLCQAAAKAGRSLYLLGARPGIAAAAGAAMCARFPGLQIAGSRDGYFTAGDEDEVIEGINGSGAAILLVALGAPRQEQWIARNRGRLAPLVAMGVGGLFDFYSGRIRRAPPWMREIGMEWVYRLLQEPRRMWRRYIIGNPVFLYRVWLQRRRPERFEPHPDENRQLGARPSTEEER